MPRRVSAASLQQRINALARQYGLTAPRLPGVPRVGFSGASSREVVRRKYRNQGRTGTASRVIIPGGVGNFKQPFGPRMNRIVSYSGVHTMSVGSTGVLGSIQKYNLNGLYDPDVTGAGHQPYGFDAMSTIYTRHKVNACKVELIISDPTIDSMSIAWLMTNPSNTADTIAGSSPYQIQERTMGGTTLLNSSGSQKVKKTFWFPMYKCANLSKLQFKADPDNFTGSDSGNPGSLCQFQFAVADLRGGSAGSVMIEIKLHYFTTFYDRKVLATS